MSYWDIAEMAMDGQITQRCQACAAQEQPGNPWAWVSEHILQLTSQPGWADAWASAGASNTEDRGKDPGVITDSMVLSAVQLLISEDGDS